MFNNPLLIFIIGMISGTILTLLTMLVLFAVGYNTIGTLLQIFSPETYLPSLREISRAKAQRFVNDGSEDNE